MINLAVIQLSDNVVVNKVVAETIDISPPDGCYFVQIDGVMCDMGWTWNGSEFIAPVVTDAN